MASTYTSIEELNAFPDGSSVDNSLLAVHIAGSQTYKMSVSDFNQKSTESAQHYAELAEEAYDGSVAIQQAIQASTTAATTAATNAGISEANAAASETAAATAAQEAAASATSLANAVTSARNSANAALSYEEGAEDAATLAQSWAAGGTNTRQGENTNNAHYWALMAQGFAEAGISVCITQNLTKAQWDSHNIGDEDTWLDTATERRGTRINDIFIVTGTATDSLDAYFLIYRSTTAEGDLQGTLLSKSIAYRGAVGITPSVTMNASVLPTGGIPDVDVRKSGTDAAPVFDLTFSGLKGEKGAIGIPGRDGADGNGIASIVKTETSGLVDTYTILMTNGTTATFTVTNGENGHVIKDSSGTSMPQRSKLQFNGAAVTDDSTNGKTIVTTTPQSMISDAWISGHTYAVRDYCIDGNVLYKCKTAHTSSASYRPPYASYWDAVTVSSELNMDNGIVLPFTYLNGFKNVSITSYTVIRQIFSNWYLLNLAVESTQAFSKEQNVNILQLDNSSIKFMESITIEATTNNLHHVAVIYDINGSTPNIRIWTREAISIGERIYGQMILKRTT